MPFAALTRAAHFPKLDSVQSCLLIGLSTKDTLGTLRPQKSLWYLLPPQLFVPCPPHPIICQRSPKTISGSSSLLHCLVACACAVSCSSLRQRP